MLLTRPTLNWSHPTQQFKHGLVCAEPGVSMREDGLIWGKGFTPTIAPLEWCWDTAWRRGGTCDFELKCLHLAFVGPGWAHRMGFHCLRLAVICEGLTTHELPNIFSTATLSKPELRWYIGLRMYRFSSGPPHAQQNWFTFSRDPGWRSVAMEIFYRFLMIDWVFWMAQWWQTLKQCSPQAKWRIYFASAWHGEKNQKEGMNSKLVRACMGEISYAVYFHLHLRNKSRVCAACCVLIKIK